MSKKSTSLAVLCLLLLLVSHTQAARPEPSSPKETQQVGAGEEQFDDVSTEICKGVGEEECLMRRTLVAHVDYIYTQGKKKH